MGVWSGKGVGEGWLIKRGNANASLWGESGRPMDGKVAVWTQRRATWRSNLEGWLIKKGFGVQI